jgi:hypothetical protein
MKRRSALFIVAALTLVGADTPDLSGTWELNIPKSSFGKRPAPISMKLEVVRQGEGFHSKLTSSDGTEAPAVTEGDWFLDGKYHAIAATKWSQMSKWDGSALIAENRSDNGTFEEHLKLTVSTDGKRVTENRTVKDSQGSNSSTLIWDRK